MISIGRSEGGGSAEVTVFSNGISSEYDGWVAWKWSVRSDGTLKHSDSLTWYDELRTWDPMNTLMSQNGGSMATYILLDVLLCSIAEYFYELCRILTNPKRESKYKLRIKILSDTTQQNVY